MILPSVGLNEKVHKGFSVSPALKLRLHGNVFQFQNAVSLIGDDTFRFYPVVLQHIHSATLQIAVNHILLLIRQ